MSDTGNRIPRIYSGFRGVDFRGEEINLVRSPDSLNVWKDYKTTESIRTRPAMKLAEQFSDAIHGIYFHKSRTFVHSGSTIYTKKGNGAYIALPYSVYGTRSNGFVFEDTFYFMDGKNYLYWDEKNEKFADVVGYVPTTTIGKKPQSGGTHHEDVNMLQRKRINTFRADGNSKEFWLDAEDIDTDFEPIVKSLDNQKLPDHTVNYAKGTITFATVPSAPLTDGKDNISVEFAKTVDKYKDSILNCTLLQVFDNRVFVSGNKDYPNVVWHCSLNDPTYFSDTDYYREGMDEAQVTGMVAGNNALWVFREPSEANTNVFYHTPAVDDTHGKIYPSSHSSVTTGCIGAAINFNDDIVFFSERGMEGISGDVTTEQVVAHRSSLVDRKLLVNPEYEYMVLAEWEGYLLVFTGDEVYLADSRARFTNEDHYEYEFYYWKLEKEVTCAKVHNGILYIGTRDGGVYTLTDTECDVESWWSTPLDKFQSPNMEKTSNKRGCVVEGSGKDICVYVKTNRDSEWQLVGTYASVTDAFTCKIKKKKFKDIKLKFYSSKRFSLESATLECFVGGYIKRI